MKYLILPALALSLLLAGCAAKSGGDVVGNSLKPPHPMGHQIMDESSGTCAAEGGSCSSCGDKSGSCATCPHCGSEHKAGAECGCGHEEHHKAPAKTKGKKAK